MVYEWPKRVFFDLDDTLIDTSFSIFSRLTMLLEKYPVQEGLLFIYNLLSNTQREEILACRYNFSKQFWQEYEGLRNKIKPKPIGDVRGKLEKIVGSCEQVGILTNASESKISYALDVIGLSPSFFGAGVYGRHNLCYPKPDIRCISEISKGVAPSKVIYIGDDIRDYLFSLDGSISFLAVCTGLTSKETFKIMGLNEKFIFPSIQEVELDATKM